MIGNRTSTAVSAQNTKTEYAFNRANLVTSAEHKQLVNDAWVTLSSEKRIKGEMDGS